MSISLEETDINKKVNGLAAVNNTVITTFVSKQWVMQHSSHNITPKTPQVQFVIQNKSKNWSNTQAGAGIDSYVVSSRFWQPQRQDGKSQQLKWL